MKKQNDWISTIKSERGFFKNLNFGSIKNTETDESKDIIVKGLGSRALLVCAPAIVGLLLSSYISYRIGATDFYRSETRVYDDLGLLK